jgi:hypothetical protein
MPPRRRDFGACAWPVLGERSVRRGDDPHRSERAASRAPMGPASANEADERIDLGHRCRSDAS